MPVNLVQELREAAQKQREVISDQRQTDPDVLDRAADRVEKLENDLDVAREGLKDIAGRAHSRLANSQTSIG